MREGIGIEIGHGDTIRVNYETTVQLSTSFSEFFIVPVIYSRKRTKRELQLLLENVPARYDKNEYRSKYKMIDV